MEGSRRSYPLPTGREPAPVGSNSSSPSLSSLPASGVITCSSLKILSLTSVISVTPCPSANHWPSGVHLRNSLGNSLSLSTFSLPNTLSTANVHHATVSNRRQSRSRTVASSRLLRPLPDVPAPSLRSRELLEELGKPSLYASHEMATMSLLMISPTTNFSCSTSSKRSKLSDASPSLSSQVRSSTH